MLFAMMLLASAQDTQAPQTPVAPAKPAKICRSIPMTGTRLGGQRKDCRTREEWQHEDRQAGGQDIDVRRGTGNVGN
jgi:hypothetical protein